MVTATRKLTYEDYAKMPDDERYELLDGELVFMPSPTVIHQRLLRRLLIALSMWADELLLGEVHVSPLDVVLADTVVVQPDIMFISNERASVITEPNIQGAPDLAIEIISPSDPNRDRVRKREIYERHGVGEYWLVDPYAHNITVLTLAERRYETAGIYGETDTLTSPTLRGFALNVSDLF